jgi:hypothetical protein
MSQQDPRDARVAAPRVPEAVTLAETHPGAGPGT